MIVLWFTFQGLDEIIRDLERAQAKLSYGFAEPLRRTRDALWLEIRDLFQSSGRSTTRGQAPEPWPPWAADTRDRRELRLPTTWANNDYYDVAPGPIDDVIGVWTGEMRAALTSDTPPGFSDITRDTLEMGIRPTHGSDVKWAAFIEGWSKGMAHQPPRAIYENLHVDDVGMDVFANWLRDEVPLFQQAESDQSEFLGLS